MKPLATLLRLHFTGSTLHRGSSLAGVLLTAIGLIGLFRFPQYMFVWGKTSMSAASIAFSFVLGVVPVLGIVTLFLGGGLMPTIFVRLTRGRQLSMLPGGRARLLISSLLVLCVVATAFSAVIKVLYANYPLDQGELLVKAFVISFVMFALLYGLLWLVSQARSALMILAGTLLLLPCLLLPFHYVEMPSSSVRGSLIIGLLLLLIAGSALYLKWPRTHRLAGIPGGTWVGRLRYRPLQRRGYALILGLPHPLGLALGQAVPMAAASIYITAPSIWLFYFALCSLMGGASASFAAPRSRILWLLLPNSREQLYRRVEAVYWRQNAYGVGALMLLLIVLGTLREIDARLLAIGIPLLLAGITAGTYLGLMMTGPLRAWDAALAVGTMVLMLSLAYFSERVDVWTAAAGIGLLMLASVMSREISRRRWRDIDWAVNRPART